MLKYKLLNILIVLSLIISMCEGLAYVYSGMYGDLSRIGAGNALLILI